MGSPNWSLRRSTRRKNRDSLIKLREEVNARPPPVRTLHAGPNPKYFGYEHGATYYNLVSNQFTGLNAIVVPGTLKDSLSLLAVVLEQQTELQPIEIMTDTGAYTDVVFGLFWLLGYRFSPRIADIGRTYWRMDANADYGVLNGVARHKINSKVIEDNWDDALRLAGSLKMGVVQATAVMRTLQISDRPTKLAQAIAELGRIDKTIHALTFIDDESKRRRTLVQLNRHEDRHKLARAVFHGRRGELRQRYRERPGGPTWRAWASGQHHHSLEHAVRAMRFARTMSPGYRRSFSSTSMFSDAMRFPCRTRLGVGN
jgi:TnpA family transposase